MPNQRGLTLVGQKASALLYAVSCLFLLAVFRMIAFPRIKGEATIIHGRELRLRKYLCQGERNPIL